MTRKFYTTEEFKNYTLNPLSLDFDDFEKMSAIIESCSSPIHFNALDYSTFIDARFLINALYNAGIPFMYRGRNHLNFESFLKTPDITDILASLYLYQYIQCCYMDEVMTYDCFLGKNNKAYTLYVLSGKILTLREKRTFNLVFVLPMNLCQSFRVIDEIPQYLRQPASLVTMCRTNVNDANEITRDIEGESAIAYNLASMDRLLNSFENYLYAHYGKGCLIVNSCYRNPAVNSAVGGVSNSRHLRGLAVDIKYTGIQARTLLEHLRNFLSMYEPATLRYSYAISTSSIHFDIEFNFTPFVYE